MTGQLVAVEYCVTAGLVPTDASCAGLADGSYQATPSGGITPYSFSWSNLATTQNISGLAAGSYTVIVTDVLGCAGSNSTTVNEPAAMT